MKRPPQTNSLPALPALHSLPPCSTHFVLQQLASGWLLGAQLSGDLLQDRGRQLPTVARQEVPQQGVHLACRDKRMGRWLSQVLSTCQSGGQTGREATYGFLPTLQSLPERQAPIPFILNPPLSAFIHRGDGGGQGS